MKHAHERRRHERRPVSKSVSISVLGSLAEHRECLEQAEKGFLLSCGDKVMRLATDHHLSPGKLVRIEDPAEPRAGVVMCGECARC